MLVLPHDLGKVIGLFNTHEPPPWRPLRPWTMSGAMAMYSKSSAHNMCFQGISNLLIPPKGHDIAVPFGEYQIPGKQEVHVIEKKWAIFPTS